MSGVQIGKGITKGKIKGIPCMEKSKRSMEKIRAQWERSNGSTGKIRRNQGKNNRELRERSKGAKEKIKGFSATTKKRRFQCFTFAHPHNFVNLSNPSGVMRSRNPIMEADSVRDKSTNRDTNTTTPVDIY